MDKNNNDNGFYNGYDNNGYGNASQNTPKMDQQSYEAQSQALIDAYKRDHPSGSKEVSYDVYTGRNKFKRMKQQWDIERGRVDPTGVDVYAEPTEEQKMQYQRMADNIMYQRSLGSGYSNGGSSQYDMVGGSRQDGATGERYQNTDSNPFYTSYDQQPQPQQQNPNGGQYYNSYDQQPQGGQYDNPYGQQPMPDERLYHPQQEERPYSRKRVATVKDGKSRFMPQIMIGAIILAICIIAFVFGMINHINSQSFIDSADKVDGNTTFITHTTRNFHKRYSVSYEYRYNDRTYKGSDVMNEDQAAELGLTKNFVISNVPVTVYVDPQNPKKSTLTAEAVITTGPLSFLTPVGGLILLIFGLVIWNDFRNGRYMVTEDSGKMKFERIK